MTARPDRVAPNVMRVAAAALVVATAVLLIDYVRARSAAPADAASVAALQQKVESDRTFASTLAAEQDRITRQRQARKRRTDALAIVALAAAGLFVAGAKWASAAQGRRPVALPVNAIRIELSDPLRPPSPDVSSSGLSPAPAADAVDLSCVDALVGVHGRTQDAAIPILQAIQAHYRYLPDEALRRVCELTDVTPAQIAGTSTFYGRFRRSPVGDHVVRVCHGTACHVSGARQVTEELRRHLHIPDGADTDAARRFTIDEVACLGCCSLAPVLMVDDQTAGRLTPTTAVAALALARETEPA